MVKSIATRSMYFTVGLCSCVTMYESVLSQEEVEDVLKEDHWLAVKLSYEEELQQRYPHRKAAHNVFEGKVLLLAGTCTGNLLVLGQKGGGADVCCCVQAHENRVTLIANNPKADQVISAGEGICLCAYVWCVLNTTSHNFVCMHSYVAHTYTPKKQISSCASGHTNPMIHWDTWALIKC